MFMFCHFLVARLFGVGVLKFSQGFGPRITGGGNKSGIPTTFGQTLFHSGYMGKYVWFLLLRLA
jgi:membrane-associated protease RseP (regulator of RpoE activity)